MSELTNRPTTVADYLSVVRRRKVLIIVLPLIAAVAAVLVSRSEKPLYQASADVLVQRTTLSSVGGISDYSITDPTRYLATLASMARSPDLAQRVVAAAGATMSPEAFSGKSSATANADADLLSLSVSDRSSGTAVRLANIYAAEFAKFKTDYDTGRIDQAVDGLRKQASELRRSGATNSPAYATIIEQESTYQALRQLLANSVRVLQPAEHAAKLRPRTTRNGVLAFLFGGVLGVALAFLAEALDRRVRSEEEVEATLGIPLLGRVPRPSRRLRKRNALALLADSGSVDAETFRKLRTSIEFANLDLRARTIMVTSAVQREGKSTTVANLAIAFARAGRNVALVDLDLRRPLLHRFFQVAAGPGFTDVAVGRVDLAEAMETIALSSSTTDPRRNGGSARGAEAIHVNGGGVPPSGVLHLLPAGTLPPSANDFLEKEAVTGLLARLADEHDILLVDAPPLLAFGDGVSLSSRVDAIFAVVRINVVERPTLVELGRQLETCRAGRLGFVLTGVSHGDGYRYGFEAYGYEPRPIEAQRVARRR